MDFPWNSIGRLIFIGCPIPIMVIVGSSETATLVTGHALTLKVECGLLVLVGSLRQKSLKIERKIDDLMTQYRRSADSASATEMIHRQVLEPQLMIYHHKSVKRHIILQCRPHSIKVVINTRRHRHSLCIIQALPTAGRCSSQRIKATIATQSRRPRRIQCRGLLRGKNQQPLSVNSLRCCPTR